MRKKWVSLMENTSRNNLRHQNTSTEWALKQICSTLSCKESYHFSSLAKTVAITIPERDRSAIKSYQNKQKHPQKRGLKCTTNDIIK